MTDRSAISAAHSPKGIGSSRSVETHPHTRSFRAPVGGLVYRPSPLITSQWVRLGRRIEPGTFHPRSVLAQTHCPTEAARLAELR